MCLQNRKKAWTIVIFLLVITDLFGTAGYYWAVRDGARSDRLAAHKTAVILFSNFDADGKLDEETLRRIHHAVESIRQQDSHLILCCGGARPQSERYGTLLMRDYLL